MPQQPLVILGAGIGGLTLGRCLRKEGIPSVIYEKATSSKRHNYGITLHKWAYTPLLQMLNIDEHSFRRQLAVDSLHHAGIGELYSHESQALRTNTSGSFRANRFKLERLLREGQDIKWEHDLSPVRMASDLARSTSLTFQNSLAISSSFVVDALGVHSPLRTSLLPDYNFNVLPFVVFSGKRRVTHQEFVTIYAPHLKDANILTLRPAIDQRVLLQIWVDDHPSNSEVQITYVYSRPARSNHHERPDPLHNPSRPLNGATDIPDAFYHELQLLFAKTELPDPFSSTFDPARIRPERVLHWLMRTMHVSTADLHKVLDESGIIMIGDSAHPMPILGGDGANHAIKDAVEVAGLIASSLSAQPTRLGSDSSTRARFNKQAVKELYEKCWSRWQSGIMESEENIASMHD
ncbi:hypothetical protein GJ744_008829 [Endocarpon pusillum]|uniref:FAD-binding domain-containing protein n=1 Tax=Endocarpon pusillum TaxID=364733 RepID=A0A8H7E9J3_9EURO|nr:hypothetical protein GJ744_008829 [Endocarpon pusillum]